MKKKHIKYVIIGIISLLIIIFSVLIYINLFADSTNSRNKNMKEYAITNNEKNSVKNKIMELEEVSNIDIHTNNNSRIVKIMVTLDKDVEFNKIKTLANEVLSNFSEQNISYYDFEFFVDSNAEDTEVYPKIGYKFRANSEFSW